MPPHWADFEKSLRRSHGRRRVLMALASLSVSYPTPLAHAAEVTYHRLQQILHGDPPDYKVELALIPMGLAREIHGPNGRAYEITTRGRKKARQVSARVARRAARRAAERRAAERRAPEPADRSEAGGRAVDPGVSFTWTFTRSG